MRKAMACGNAWRRAVSSSTMRIRRSSIGNVPFLWLTVKWQLEQKKRTRARMVFEQNIPLMFLNNSIRNREAQTCSRANFFLSKKWVKNALFNLGGNTRASIMDADINHLSLRCAGDSNQFFSHINQCVARVS